MNVAQMIDRLRQDGDFRWNLTAWRTLPPRPAKYADFPPEVLPELREGLGRRGIEHLYSHQAEAVEAIFRGENVCEIGRAHV